MRLDCRSVAMPGGVVAALRGSAAPAQALDEARPAPVRMRAGLQAGQWGGPIVPRKHRPGA